MKETNKELEKKECSDIGIKSKRKYWTSEEDNYLKNNYSIMSVNNISLYLKRSGNSVRHRAVHFNLSNHRFYSKEDDQLIKENFENNRKGLNEILNRNWNSISKRAWILGMKANKVGSSCLAYKGSGEVSGSFINKIKINALKRNIDFKVTAKELDDLYNKQDKKCALSGEDISFKSSKGHPFGNASLDRIISKEGIYEINNVQFLTSDVNIMKQSLTDQELINWCEIITKFNQNGKNFMKNPADSISKIKRGNLWLWRGCGNLSKGTYCKIIKGAMERNIKFDLDIEYLWNLFLEQKGYCALSGVEIKFEPSRERTREKTASLDRIDSSKGYIEGNVQWTHKQLNIGKMRLSDEEFYRICRNIYNNSLKV